MNGAQEGKQCFELLCISQPVFQNSSNELLKFYLPKEFGFIYTHLPVMFKCSLMNSCFRFVF